MNFLAAALPAIAIALVYAGVWDHTFVWDDGPLSNAQVYQVCDLEAIFTTPANTFEYLPVRDLTLCVDHALFGNWAGGFHLQNVAIFMLACVLLGSLYRRILAASPDAEIAKRAPLLALLCSLVFALHPLQVEPVAFITARNALLALLFVCATLIAVERWIATSKPYWYLLSIAFTALALFSKATALPVAGLVFLLHYYLARDTAWTRCVAVAAPHVVVTAAAALLHTIIASTHGAMGAAPSLAELVRRLPRAVFVPQFYLYKFVWPIEQSTEYVLDGVRENVLWFAATGVAMACAFGWILWRGAPRRSTAALFAAGYLVALIPVLNLLPTYPPVADRYAQLPLVFLTPLIVVSV
ncbi:MAG: hypothetical protein GY733_23155, partial [bacterium]|nr:hypothetical protein [bacterium]